MIVSLFLLAIPIVIADIRYRKIPNIYLWYLILFLVPSMLFSGLGSLKQLMFFLSISAVLTILGMGMGDMKLLSIIALWLNTDENRSPIFFGALLILLSAVHIYWMAMKTRSISVSIPLAPSIFLALSLYLAT
ncbi:MAG: hypothetical protein FGM60_00380 [Candidatus Planktophila sp.]|nr:hypothetical protein [Candidatus Planktophila sp.]